MSVATRPRSAKATAKKTPVVSLALSIDHMVYTVEPIPAGEFGTKAFRLVKQSSRDDVYDVIRTNEGLVECDCPSYEKTHRGTVSTCKHGQALVKLGLLEAPAYQPSVDAPADKPTTVEPKPTDNPDADLPITHDIDDDEEREFFDGPDASLKSETVPASCCSPSEPVPCAACEPALTTAQRITLESASLNPNWPAEHHQSIGEHLAQAGHVVLGGTEPYPAESPAAVWNPPAEAQSFTSTDVEPDPLAELPFPKPAAKVARKPVAPLKPLPLTPGTLYTLDELVDGQASLFRGHEGSAYAFIADELAALAERIRMVKATTPDEYLGRIREMDYDADMKTWDTAYRQGYAKAQAECGC